MTAQIALLMPAPSPSIPVKTADSYPTRYAANDEHGVLWLAHPDWRGEKGRELVVFCEGYAGKRTAGSVTVNAISDYREKVTIQGYAYRADVTDIRSAVVRRVGDKLTLDQITEVCRDIVLELRAWMARSLESVLAELADKPDETGKPPRADRYRETLRRLRAGLLDGRTLNQHLADHGLTHKRLGSSHKHRVSDADGQSLFIGFADEVWGWLAGRVTP